MSNPEYHRGPCPLQDAIEQFRLADFVKNKGILQMTVSCVHLLPDKPFREAQLPSFDNPHVVPQQAQLAEYGDMVVVFKVRERSQE